MKKLLVYGYYGKGNLGDNLIEESIRYFFRDYELKFCNKIVVSDLLYCDGIIIGGGSILEGKIEKKGVSLEMIKSKVIVYLGIGGETYIHSDHIELMKVSKVIGLRAGYDHIKSELEKYNIKCIYKMLDLVYLYFISCGKLISNNEGFNNEGIKNEGSILVIPNISVVPKLGDGHWKYVAWDYYLSEFVQFLSELEKGGKVVRFLNMGEGDYEVSGMIISNWDRGYYRNDRRVYETLMEVIMEVRIGNK